MEFGAITGYIDLAQIILYLFWMFFAGLIYYLAREGHREGYPMETDSLGRAAIKGWPVPLQPKVFKTAHGDVVVPDLKKGEPRFAGTVSSDLPGSPLDPQGDPMRAGVGAGAWANRAEVPDMMLNGQPKLVPLRAAKAYGVSTNDTDPRGLPVMGGDHKPAGKVVDLWLDQAEMLFRYLEVEVPVPGGSRNVLLPVPFARIGAQQVDVKSIYAVHFADVPALKDPLQITFMEEELICAYYGAGTLYADPKRGEPIL